MFSTIQYNWLFHTYADHFQTDCKRKLTKFDKFAKLKNVFVESVIVDHWEYCLIEPLQLFHVVDGHITELNNSTAAVKQPKPTK